MPMRAPTEPASLKGILRVFIAGLATRMQIVDLEAASARRHAIKAVVYAVMAIVFGIFALIFIPLGLVCIFWEFEAARIAISCAFAGVYTLLFLIFLIVAISYAKGVPETFEQTKQIFRSDIEAMSRAAAAQRPLWQEEEMQGERDAR
ncbi:MAG: phage holin family protein [Burkholderiales bacterium]|nr:phage holin family protein [Burkholderiales bacterium]